MNLAVLPIDPPLTPPRRGPGHAVRLPSLEGLGVGSFSQCMLQKIKQGVSEKLFMAASGFEDTVVQNGQEFWKFPADEHDVSRGFG